MERINYWSRTKKGEWICSEKLGKRTQVIEKNSSTGEFQKMLHTLITVGEEKSMIFFTHCGYDRGPKFISRLNKLIGVHNEK